MDPGLVSAARWLRLCAAAMVTILACSMAVVSVLEYETLKSHVDAFTVDRDADVSREDFESFVVRLRVFALLLGALGLALVSFGSRLDRLTASVVSSWWGSWRGGPQALRLWARREGTLHVLSLVVVVAAGVGARLSFLDAPMRYDEAATYNGFVSQPLYVAVANYSEPNNHLFHTVLAALSVDVFGGDPWSLRLTALVAGIAVILLSYVLAQRLYNPTAALLTAALVASSSTLIEYSTNARGYSLLVAFTLGALVAGARVIETGSPGAWAAVAACSVLGFYTLPTMAYAFGGVLVWVGGSQLLRGDGWRDIIVALSVCAAVTAVVSAVLYAPVFAASGIEAVTSNRFVRPRDAGEFLGGLPDHAWATLDSWTRDVPLVLSVILVAAVVASLLLTRKLSRFPLPPLLAMLAWSVALLLVQRVLPFTRVWLFFAPVVFATGAGFIGWLVERRRSGVIVGPAVALVVVFVGVGWVIRSDSVRTSTETGSLPDAPAIATYLGTVLRPGDSVLAVGSDAILSYYLARDGRDADALIWQRPGPRVFVVVNRVKGDQTLRTALDELPADVHYEQPLHLRDWPSAELYLVRTV